MRGKAPITLSDDARKRAIASIRRYFDENLESEIGPLLSLGVHLLGQAPDDRAHARQHESSLMNRHEHT
jgi:hypothetical protein